MPQPAEQKWNVTFEIAEDGTVQPTARALPGSIKYDRLHIVATLPENLTDAAMSKRVENALSKTGINWIRRLQTPGRWVINLDEMRKSVAHSNDSALLIGRVEIKHRFGNDSYLDNGKLIQTSTIEWQYSLDAAREELVTRPELERFTDKFLLDHPDPTKCAFVIMRFEKSPWHDECIKAIEDTCLAHGFEALRADSRSYSDDLLPNVRTYMHACRFGIAVFEKVTQEDQNPNVALEVGYMMALDRPVCLLKERSIKAIQSDLIGRLYRSFDHLKTTDTIKAELESWLKDKGLI